MPETSAAEAADVLTAPETVGANDVVTAPHAASQGGRLTFHPLTFLADGDEVTIGRADQAEYIVLPADAAALLRRLAEGSTVEAAADWYAAAYGESVDVSSFVADLDQLGYLKHEGDPAVVVGTVRWQGLAKVVFGPVGAMVFVALLAGWGYACSRTPQLLPHPRNLFFTHYMSVMVVAVSLSQLPLVLIHETAHALAGRKLGLRSRLSIGRRLYFLVFQTTMDGLVGVPRSKRYLPILAGILSDIAAIATLSLLAYAGRDSAGQFDGLAQFVLAAAYLTWLRLLWQLWIFIQTDLYYLVVTIFGCVDLQTTARQRLHNRFRQLAGRPPAHDEAGWHPRDRSVSAWYAWLMLAGYVACIVSLFTTVLPVLARLAGNVFRAFTEQAHRSSASVADSVILLAMLLGELSTVAYLYLRERRAASAAGRRS